MGVSFSTKMLICTRSMSKAIITKPIYIKRKEMPTINQLVRKERKKVIKNLNHQR